MVETKLGARAQKLAQQGTQARPGARRPCRIMAGPGRVLAEAPDHIAALGFRVVVPRACPCALCRARHTPGLSAVTQRPRPYRGRVPHTAFFVSRLGLPAVSRYKIWLLPFPSRNIVQCIAIHYSLLPAPSWSRYNICIVTILFFFPASRLTSLSQYNPPQSRYTWCIMTQKPSATLPFSHSACHNTIIVL